MNVHPLLTQGAQPCGSCHATGMLSAPVFLDNDANPDRVVVRMR